MPIYEYVCESCGRLTEVMQRSTDPAPACPECGGSKLARIVSRTSFQLKGGGWYSDLYATPKKKPDAPEPAGGGATAKPDGGAGASAAKPDGGAGAKPAAAAPAPASASKPSKGSGAS